MDQYSTTKLMEVFWWFLVTIVGCTSCGYCFHKEQGNYVWVLLCHCNVKRGENLCVVRAMQYMHAISVALRQLMKEQCGRHGQQQRFGVTSLSAINVHENLHFWLFLKLFVRMPLRWETTTNSTKYAEKDGVGGFAPINAYNATPSGMDSGGDLGPCSKPSWRSCCCSCMESELAQTLRKCCFDTNQKMLLVHLALSWKSTVCFAET